MARRRAVAHGAAVLRTLDRICGKVSQAGSANSYTFQTNGTLIDDEWAAFFKKHNFLIGISIDGPKEMHDAYRVDKGGQPTFDKVMRGLRHLQQARRRLQRPDHAARGQRRPPGRGLPLLARRVQGEVDSVHPDHRAVHRRGRGVEIVARSPALQQKGVERHLAIDHRRAVRAASISASSKNGCATTSAASSSSSSTSRWRTCTARGRPLHLQAHLRHGVALEHNGDVYSCDHFVEPKYKLGNMREAADRSRQLAAAALVRRA